MLTQRVYSGITLPMEKSKFNFDYRKSDYNFFVTIRFINLHCIPVNTVLMGELQISCFYKGLEEFKV